MSTGNVTEPNALLARVTEDAVAPLAWQLTTALVAAAAPTLASLAAGLKTTADTYRVHPEQISGLGQRYPDATHGPNPHFTGCQTGVVVGARSAVVCCVPPQAGIGRVTPGMLGETLAKGHAMLEARGHVVLGENHVGELCRPMAGEMVHWQADLVLCEWELLGLKRPLPLVRISPESVTRATVIAHAAGVAFNNQWDTLMGQQVSLLVRQALGNKPRLNANGWAKRLSKELGRFAKMDLPDTPLTDALRRQLAKLPRKRPGKQATARRRADWLTRVVQAMTEARNSVMSVYAYDAIANYAATHAGEVPRVIGLVGTAHARHIDEAITQAREDLATPARREL